MASPESSAGTASPVTTTFLLLVTVQALHSIEEYRGWLYDVFPPARLVSGLISADRERGFLIANIAFVGFGLWCYLWPIRHRWRSASALMWLWVVVEMVNGVGHPAWSLVQGGYTPGVATAPFLLVLALVLAYQLQSSR
jgi:hypothetical protein